MLRQEYLASIREQVRHMLDQIEVVDAPLEGPKVTQVNEIAFSLRPSHKLH